MGYVWISTPKGHRWGIDFLKGACSRKGASIESQVGSINLVGSFRKIEELARLRISQECFRKIVDGSLEGLTEHNPCNLVTTFRTSIHNKSLPTTIQDGLNSSSDHCLL